MNDSKHFRIQNSVLKGYGGPGGDVTIPDSVTSIGAEAFNDCTSLTSITIPNSVTSIGDWAFDGCTSLTSITIPNSVTSIGFGAFNDCTSLTSITIPNSVTTIGDWAFNDCTSLTSITIPDSVTSIGAGEFFGCTSLTSIVVAENNPVYHSRANCLIQTKKKALITGCSTSVIPADGSVTTIGAEAFSGCERLTSITIPDSVTSIGDDAFNDCTSLTSITIPNSVTTIGAEAFNDCTSLTSITIPNSVTSIGFGAFNDCTSLTSITIPNSVTTIGDWAFSGCERLTSITIPDSVTTIGDRAFLGCERLTSIVVAENNPVYHSSANCLIETKSKTLIAGCSTSVIPADGSITSIGDDAFRYCTNLTSITIPSSVTKIGDSAFDGCKRLKSVAFGENSQLTSIAKDLFSDCESLTSITCSSTLAKELNRFLPSKPIILHIADLSNVSAKFRPAAAVGFAEDDRDCTDENGKKYLKYIKANATKLAKEAVKHPALLYLMLREKLIAAKDLEAVTATVQESGNAELIAAMLEYGNSAVSEKEKAKVQQKKEERETNVTNFIFDATKVEKLNGKTFAVTGKLKTFASRDELKECLTACGATLTETLQKGVNYLITNTPDSGSAKNQQAMKLNIRRITEAQFNEMIGRTVAQSGRGETF